MASASPGTEMACQVLLKSSQGCPSSHSWATPEGSALSNAVACWQEQLLVESINSDTPAAGIKEVSAFKGGSGQSTTVSTTIMCYVHDHIASKRLEFKLKFI